MSEKNFKELGANFGNKISSSKNSKKSFKKLEVETSENSEIKIWNLKSRNDISKSIGNKISFLKTRRFVYRFEEFEKKI